MARTPFKMLISFDRIIKRTLAPLYPLESCCVLAQMSIVAPPRPPAASMLVLLSQQRSAQSLVTKLSGPIRSGGQPKTGIRIHLYKGCDQDRLESMPVPPDQVASSLQLPSGEKKHLEVDIGRKQSIEPAPLSCTAHQCIRRRCRPPRSALATLIGSGKYLLQGLICSQATSNPGSQFIIIAPSGDVDRLYCRWQYYYSIVCKAY